MKFKFFVYHLFFLAPSFLQGQDFVFKNYTSEDGLASSEVHGCYQDKNGYMWFATDQGLSRFDGLVFKTFIDENFSKSSYINLFEESSNKIWLLNLKNELHWFNPLKDSIIFHPFKYADTLCRIIDKLKFDTYIRCFRKIEDTYVLNFVGPGLVKIKATDEMEISIEGLDLKTEFNYDEYVQRRNLIIAIEDNYVYTLDSLHTSSEYQFFLKTKRGLTKLEYSNNLNGRNYVGVYDFHRLGDEMLFLFGNLFIRYNLKNELYSITELQAFGLKIKVHQNQIFITSYEGIHVLNESNEIKNIWFKNDVVTDMFFSDNNEMWITTTTNGVYYVPEFQTKTINCSNEIIQIEKKDDSTFLLLDTKSSLHFFRNDSVFRTIEKVGGSKYAFNVKDTSVHKYLWRPNVKNGLKHETFVLPQYKYFNYIPFRKNLYEVRNYQFNHIYHSTAFNHHFLPLDDTTYYLADENGIYKIQEKNGELNLDFEKGLVVKGNIKQFELFQDGLLYFSEDRGFEYRNKQGVIYPLSKYLNLGVIKQFDMDDTFPNVIWIATNNGLHRITYKNNKITNHQVLTTKNGLPANDIIAFLQTDTSIYVSTKKGAVYFPQKKNFPLKNLESNFFQIDSIAINEVTSKVKFSDTINLINNQRLDIYFKQINYSISGNINYEYRLKEKNNHWKKTNGNQLILTNLDKGFFSLEIRPYFGLEKGEIKILYIVSNVPWFYKRHMLVLYALISIAIISLIFILLLKRQNKQKQAEVEKVQLELRALVSQMNPHFTFNTINSIQHFIALEDKKTALNYLSDFAMLIRRTLDYSRKEYLTIQEEIEFIQLYVSLENKRFENEVNLTVKMTVAGDPNQIAIPALLFQPLIENALIHGLQGLNYSPKLYFEISEQDAYYEFIIQDNGKGMSKSNRTTTQKERTSHGLSILKSRLELFNKGKKLDEYFQVKSSDEGTTIIIRLAKPIIIH